MGEAADTQTIEVAPGQCWRTVSGPVVNASTADPSTRSAAVVTMETQCVHHKPFQARFSHTYSSDTPSTVPHLPSFGRLRAVVSSIHNDLAFRSVGWRPC